MEFDLYNNKIELWGFQFTKTILDIHDLLTVKSPEISRQTNNSNSYWPSVQMEFSSSIQTFELPPIFFLPDQTRRTERRDPQTQIHNKDVAQRNTLHS